MLSMLSYVHVIEYDPAFAADVLSKWAMALRPTDGIVDITAAPEVRLTSDLTRTTLTGSLLSATVMEQAGQSITESV